MTDGRRTLGDISRAVNNLDRNPTRLLFGAGNYSAGGACATAETGAGRAEAAIEPLPATGQASSESKASPNSRKQWKLGCAENAQLSSRCAGGETIKC